jgi:hypothetical protein
LLRAWRNFGDAPEYSSSPFFNAAPLNRSILVKHRLRANEKDDFVDQRTVATKILIPLDSDDLKLGAHSVFINQTGYVERLGQFLGGELSATSRDVQLLNILDEMPSVDPFLLREQLRRKGYEPARCYFDVSEADTLRMLHFVEREIAPLVNMSLKTDSGLGAEANRLAKKILSSEVDADMLPLRQVLQLDEKQFEEGIFCWKAFLYYKWQISMLTPTFKDVILELQAIKPIGQADSETLAQLGASRFLIRKRISLAFKRVNSTIGIYDAAYKELTQFGKPKGFREFLLIAPSLFHQIGEALAGVEHIASFWRYRFPKGRLINIKVEELGDLFADFESSLLIDESDPA